MNETIAIAIITGVVSIVGAYFTSKKTSAKTVNDGAVQLEHRLTAIETKLDGIKDGMITKEERACLVEVQTSLNWALTTLLGDAVHGLRNPVSLDVILTKLETEIQTKGYKAAFHVFDGLTPAEDQELTEYLEKTIKSSRSHIKKQRARLILGMKTSLKQALNEKGATCEV